MKIMEIAKRIDKSKKNESYVDISEFNHELDFNFHYTEQDRLKAYWISNWQCTDTYVGCEMYFLDDVPVAMSSRTARKMNKEFKWFSKELALKVRKYLVSLMEEDLKIEICDMGSDFGDSFKISFNSQIINYDKVMLNGEIVEIIEKFPHKYNIGSELKIRTSEGEKNVDIEALNFGYHLV